MTQEEIDKQIKAIRDVTEKATQSKETARQFLIDAGIVQPTMTQQQIHQLAEEILIEYVGDLELYREDLIAAMVEMYQRATQTSEWEKALISLTPRGSEFVGDPERCVESIKQFQDMQYQHIVRLTKENKSLRATLKQIANWGLPEPSPEWDRENKSGYSYEQAFGQEGAKQFIRNIAESALQQAAEISPLPLVATENKEDKVNRVEVIDEKGRSYVNWDNRNKVELDYQDGGRTLKIFITKASKTDK